MKLSVTIIAALMSAYPTFAEEPIAGRASVIDGDTIEIRGERIRLHGIDAPESWQICQDAVGRQYRCGKEAARRLELYLEASRPTRCEFVERDRYQRFVGVCFRNDGVEVNRWLVESGFAVDWVRYSNGKYAQEQKMARKRAEGVWKGTFELPCEARALRMMQKPSC